MSDMKTFSGALHGLCVTSRILKKGTTVRTASAGLSSFANQLSLCRTVTRVTTVVRTVTVSTSSMTMEEFQDYIWNRIDSFPFHPTRLLDEEAIHISDRCWKRMKEDAGYEKKMMNLIRDGRNTPDPFFGLGSSGAYSVLEFDGGEGCRSHMWSRNFGGNPVSARARFRRESEGSFWKSRQQRHEQYAIDEARYQQRRDEERLQQQRDGETANATGDLAAAPLTTADASAASPLAAAV